MVFFAVDSPSIFIPKDGIGARGFSFFITLETLRG